MNHSAAALQSPPALQWSRSAWHRPSSASSGQSERDFGQARLAGFAALPAESYVPASEPSRSLLGTTPINMITPPFADQPIQGFSGIIDNRDGTVDVLSDNGYGSKANSADFVLRIQRVAPDFHSSTVDVVGGVGEPRSWHDAAEPRQQQGIRGHGPVTRPAELFPLLEGTVAGDTPGRCGCTSSTWPRRRTRAGAGSTSWTRPTKRSGMPSLSTGPVPHSRTRRRAGRRGSCHEDLSGRSARPRSRWSGLGQRWPCSST
jgi:hypothetical protein